MELVIFIIIPLIIVGIVYPIIRYPDSHIIISIFKWDYRVLRKMRDVYRCGLRRTPPDSYDFFKTEAIGIINQYLSEHKPLLESPQERITKAQILANMLESQQYIHYYFNEGKDFTGAAYFAMWRDYRSGQYLTQDYFPYETLRKKMPAEFSSNKKAFNDFWKLVQAGWFDEKTGMYRDVDNKGMKINHNQIGRAVVLICQRNQIPKPSMVFARLWADTLDEENIETMEKKIRGWYRADKIKNVEQIDQIVLGIINSD